MLLPRVPGTIRRRLRRPIRALRRLASRPDRWAAAVQRADVLPQRRRRLVAVIDSNADRRTASLVANLFGRDTVRLLTAEPGRPLPGTTRRQASTMTEVREALAWFGAPDVIVLRPPRPTDDLRAAVLQLFLHLRRGGVLIIDGRGNGLERARAALSTLLDAVDQASVTDRDRLPRLERELAVGLRRMVRTRDFVVLVQGLTHQLKVRESVAERLLTERRGAPQWTVLARRPSSFIEPDVRVHHHGRSGPPVPPITEFAYPPLTLRRYEQRVAVISHSMVSAGGLMLPESNRQHLRDTLMHERALELDPWMLRLRKHQRAHEVLPGAYFHADSYIPGHYGHLMTEVASRLWAWPEAKRLCPELKVICRRSRLPERAWVDRDVLMAYGIEEQDITVIEEPVFVDELYSATPTWHNAIPHTVHPEIRTVWDRFRRRLITNPGSDRRIFVSRVPDIKNRPCTNTTQVEDFFAALGFRIVLPERLSIREQADLFAGAEVVAGFAGSGMFNVMFSTRLETMIVLSHESYTARNELMFGGLLGCDLHYFWSPAELAQSADSWTIQAFHSAWRFDIDRHAEPLRRVIG